MKRMEGKRNTTRRVTTAMKRGTTKGITLVSDPPDEQPILRYPFRFSDLSRELAWKRLWDEVYAELLPVIVEKCHEEHQAA